jgi:hypothetical protein
MPIYDIAYFFRLINHFMHEKYQTMVYAMLNNDLMHE